MKEFVGNAAALTDIFGRWPSFHDAEVLRVVLDADGAGGRSPSVEMQVYVFEMTSEVVDGRYALANRTLVTFRFYGVANLELSDLDSQNALLDLHIQDISDRGLENLKMEVKLASTLGLEGGFLCDSAEIMYVRPFVEGEGT